MQSMHLHMRICMFVCKCMCTSRYRYEYECTRPCMHACVCVCVNRRMYTYIYIYTYPYMYIYKTIQMPQTVFKVSEALPLRRLFASCSSAEVRLRLRRHRSRALLRPLATTHLGPFAGLLSRNLEYCALCLETLSLSAYKCIHTYTYKHTYIYIYIDIGNLS